MTVYRSSDVDEATPDGRLMMTEQHAKVTTTWGAANGTATPRAKQSGATGRLVSGSEPTGSAAPDSASAGSAGSPQEPAVQRDGSPSTVVGRHDGPAPATGRRSPGSVVVTGAAGFIGSHLVETLLQHGHRVVGVDRRSPRTDRLAHLNLKHVLARPRFSWVETDLLRADLDGLLDGAMCVFHLAAVPGVRASWGPNFLDYVAANISATALLLAACERAGVPRLVYASSSSVYGPAGTASRENDPTRPISPYGVTKLAGEQLCLAHATRPDSALSVIALRYFTVYGPRQRPDMAIGRILAAALTGGRYSLFGDGTQRREFTYVDDVVDATVKAAHVNASAAIVNVGGGSSVSMLDVLRLAQDVTGNPVRLTTLPSQAGDVAATMADLSAARVLLGYRPRTDLRAGITRHAEWLRRIPPDLMPAFTPLPDPDDAEVATCSY
jgi:nucleoside-diphosphate-sugar epimerase